MSYFRDLELCRYHSGPFDSSNWNCPLLSIGWLERTEDYVQENFDHREMGLKETFLVIILEVYMPVLFVRMMKICF